MKISFQIFMTLSTGFVLLHLCAAPAISAEAGLQAQLEVLAAERDFLLKGAEKVGDAPAQPVDGPLRQQLDALLKGFNFMLLWNDADAVQEVRILGRREPFQTGPRRFALKTQRQGAHHLVEAELVGATVRARLRLRLVVDTGATTLVLPESMIEPLGYDRDALRDGWSETANGRVPTKLATLNSVSIGQAKARDVEVAFLADERIGRQRLLGMSFLGRFEMTLDQKRNQILLLSR